MSSSFPSNPSENRGPALEAIAISTTCCAVAVMTTRLWVRGYMIRNIGNDDRIMIATTIVALFGMGLVMAEVSHGVGRHMGDISSGRAEEALLFNFITQIVYLWGICFAKMSIGTSLLRIASTKLWKHTILGFMAFVLIYSTAGFITLLTQCSDIRIIWDKSIKTTCWSGQAIRALGYTNFSLNIVSDFIFSIAIPLPMLWNINVSRRTKMSLFFVLSLGCFATSCAIVRITFLSEYGASGDWTWDTVDLALWSVLELNISIIAGSLPSLRPLFKKFLGSVYGSGTRIKVYYGPGGSGSKVMKKGAGWQAFPPDLDTANPQPRTTKLPSAPPIARSIDGDSQFGPQETIMSEYSPPHSKDSFELASYKVESHITSAAPPSATRKIKVNGGITKTTTMTVSYDHSGSI